MKFDLVFQDVDCQNLITFVQGNLGRKFVIHRISRNVNGEIPPHSQEFIWRTICMCLFTSQQRSGPNSPINKLLDSKPFPLSLRNCSNFISFERDVSSIISSYKGIRFAPTISERLTKNYSTLKNGAWSQIENFAKQLEDQRKTDPNPTNYELERLAAKYMQATFLGFGPKQSRNFWQELGLSRYEFVLDSRVGRWLREISFPLPLSSIALGDEEYYCFLSDVLQKWCIQSGILPCILDAVIFSRFEEE